MSHDDAHHADTKTHHTKATRPLGASLALSACVVATVLIAAPRAQAQTYPQYPQQPQYQQQQQQQYQQPLAQPQYQHYGEYGQPLYTTPQRPRGLALDESPYSIRLGIGYGVGLNGGQGGMPLELALGLRLSTPGSPGVQFLLAPELGWSIVFENDEAAEDVSGHYNTVYDNFGTLGTRIGFKIRFVEAYLLTALMVGYGRDDNFVYGVRNGLGLALFNGMIGFELSHHYRGRPATDEQEHTMRFTLTGDLITTFYDLFR